MPVNIVARNINTEFKINVNFLSRCVLSFLWSKRGRLLYVSKEGSKRSPLKMRVPNRFFEIRDLASL